MLVHHLRLEKVAEMGANQCGRMTSPFSGSNQSGYITLAFRSVQSGQQAMCLYDPRLSGAPKVAHNQCGYITPT